MNGRMEIFRDRREEIKNARWWIFLFLTVSTHRMRLTYHSSKNAASFSLELKLTSS